MWRLCQQRGCWEFSWHAGRWGRGDRGCCGATALTDKNAIVVRNLSFDEWCQLSWGLGSSLALRHLGGKAGYKHPKLVGKQGTLSIEMVSLLGQNSKKLSVSEQINFDVLVWSFVQPTTSPGTWCVYIRFHSLGTTALLYSSPDCHEATLRRQAKLSK